MVSQGHNYQNPFQPPQNPASGTGELGRQQPVFSADLTSRDVPPSSAPSPPALATRQNEPSYTSPEVGRPRGSSRSGHGRSVSLPFPALFSTKKKHPVRDLPHHQSQAEASDEVHRLLPQSAKVNQASRIMPTHTTQNAHRDLATGTCVTCGSLLRWPRELSVFKCTICLTVNDLPPTVAKRKEVDNHQDSRLLGGQMHAASKSNPSGMTHEQQPSNPNYRHVDADLRSEIRIP